MPNATPCSLCPRLVAHRDAVQREHPDYINAPVAGFGDVNARLLIVGLAPGKHGANATGRPFTGDAAGRWLFRSLYRFGYSNREVSLAGDEDLVLRDCRIVNAVRCLPPANRPTVEEIRSCNGHLRTEILALPRLEVLIALGQIAHEAVLMALREHAARGRFAHGAEHELACGVRLIDSYHCSRLNVNTGRLNRAMFDVLFARVDHLLGRPTLRHVG